MKAPIDTLKEHLPFFQGRAEKLEEPVVEEAFEEEPPLFHTNPGPEVSTEATLIEDARHKLLEQSERVRLGVDPHPEETARALSHVAFTLASSAAPDFEKAAAIAEAEANLLAGGVPEEAVKTIDNLTQAALRAAYPQDPTDTFTNQLNQADIEAYRAAIGLTSPDRSFPQAFEQAWAGLGQPLDPLIEQTGQLVEEADQQRAREITAARNETIANLARAKSHQDRAQRLAQQPHDESPEERTGVGFDPFADDEDEEEAA